MLHRYAFVSCCHSLSLASVRGHNDIWYVARLRCDASEAQHISVFRSFYISVRIGPLLDVVIGIALCRISFVSNSFSLELMLECEADSTLR